jgi:hypothetical protein
MEYRHRRRPPLFSAEFCEINGVEEAFLRLDGDIRLPICLAPVKQGQESPHRHRGARPRAWPMWS